MNARCSLLCNMIRAIWHSAYTLYMPLLARAFYLSSSILCLWGSEMASSRRAMTLHFTLPPPRDIDRPPPTLSPRKDRKILPSDAPTIIYIYYYYRAISLNAKCIWVEIVAALPLHNLHERNVQFKSIKHTNTQTDTPTFICTYIPDGRMRRPVYRSPWRSKVRWRAARKMRRKHANSWENCTTWRFSRPPRARPLKRVRDARVHFSVFFSILYLLICTSLGAARKWLAIHVHTIRRKAKVYIAKRHASFFST